MLEEEEEEEGGEAELLVCDEQYRMAVAVVVGARRGNEARREEARCLEAACREADLKTEEQPRRRDAEEEARGAIGVTVVGLAQL